MANTIHKKVNMKLIENYNKALQDIYDHVGFVPDWVVCPIMDNTDYFWDYDEETIYFAESKEEFEEEDGQYFESDIYTQRFYKKWVYGGKDYTMIFENAGVDGMKYFSIFDNTKRLKR